MNVDRDLDRIPFLLRLQEESSISRSSFQGHASSRRGERSRRNTNNNNNDPSSGNDNVDNDDEDDEGALHQSAPYIPFSSRFFGLRMRLAFTKRRFDRVEASYQAHMSSRLRRSITNNEARNLLAGLDSELDSSFSTLRVEIHRIEQAQENVRLRALPKVQQLLVLHKGFVSFLNGFLDKNPSTTSSSTPKKKCLLPMLNLGNESTTALKKLIADFAGVPTGILVHDLQCLEILLRTETLQDGSPTFRTRANSKPGKKSQQAPELLTVTEEEEMDFV